MKGKKLNNEKNLHAIFYFVLLNILNNLIIYVYVFMHIYV